MSRLTLRLPDSLHQLLISLANKEQISLNQYIVYALTRQTTETEQRVQYTALIQSLGNATSEQIQKALDEREAVNLDAGLTPEVAEALQRKLSNQS